MKFSETDTFKQIYAEIQTLLIEKLCFAESTKHYAVTKFDILYFDEIEKIIEICNFHSVIFFIKEDKIVFQKDIGFTDS